MDFRQEPMKKPWSTHKMNKTNLMLVFEYGAYNGKMSMLINGKQHDQTIVNLDLTLPSKLIIELSNKNYNLDTQMNSQGKILADKYIKLLEMKLGNMPIEPVNLFKICYYETDKSMKFYDTYWGFNGTVTIDFNQKSLIKYLLLLNNKFELNNLC